VRPRAWARLDALQLTLLVAAMAGDVKAAAAILQIVRARVPPPMGLNLRGMSSGSNRGPRGQWSGIQHGDLNVAHALGCMPQPTRPDSGRQTMHVSADHRHVWWSRSRIALRARAEAAQTWPKHGFRRPGSGFRYRDGGNYRTCR
jgi:hypothetical protein